MVVVPCSLLRTVRIHAPGQAGITEDRGARTTRYGELVLSAERFRRTLAQLGVERGDVVHCDLDAGADLAALILASLTSGLHLSIAPSQGGHRPHLAASAKLLVSRERISAAGGRMRHVSIAELGQSAAAWSLAEPAESPSTAALSVATPNGIETVDAEALARSIDNFNAAYPSVPGTRLLSGSLRPCVDSILISTLLPMALGLHVVLAGDIAADDGWLADTLDTVSWCAFDARDLVAMPALPASVQTVFCGSGRLWPTEAARAEAALGRPVQRGYGTAKAGYWALCRPGVAGGESRFAATIREMRSPLRLGDADAGCPAGEIILKPISDDGAQIKTGDVGWITPAGDLAVAGTLADVSVRHGQATLLSDLDRKLATHPDIRASRSFREHGASPTEPVISVCLTALEAAEVRDWLAERAGPGVATPDRVMTLPPSPAGLPPVEILRGVATGQAGQAVVAALTARRFRRNPAYDEAGLAASVDAALLSDGTLNFLMFWGCGPRRNAAAPDRAAVEALGDLLAAAEAAAPIRARAHVICTDLHATNNGHAESHFMTYFSEIRGLAGGIDAQFELESAVWRRGGLTKAAVSALEQEPAFEARWQAFKLRERFVHQASRHSGLEDKTAAARHYYATCLLERDVLKAMFGDHIFLTYNGPEFNECFPDLPTLYVYPGPRGRNDKPWFVDVETQVAAE